VILGNRFGGEENTMGFLFRRTTSAVLKEFSSGGRANVYGKQGDVLSWNKVGCLAPSAETASKWEKRDNGGKTTAGACFPSKQVTLCEDWGYQLSQKKAGIRGMRSYGMEKQTKEVYDQKRAHQGCRGVQASLEILLCK